MKKILIPACMFMLWAMQANAIHQLKFLAELGIDEPLRVTIDEEKRIYITRKDGNAVVLSLDGKTILTIEGKDSARKSVLKRPSGIAVYKDRIYLTDSSLDRVVIFSRNGEYLESFGDGGSAPKEFSRPLGICVYQGVIYVADSGN